MRVDQVSLVPGDTADFTRKYRISRASSTQSIAGCKQEAVALVAFESMICDFQILDGYFCECK